MSRQPSPAPSHPQQFHNQMYQQPLPPQPASSSKQSKPKPYAPGITAGAEDVKYQTKYKELKKKVKEIELDNDRLYLKLLLAKKNIRRMNLERAILYERLAAVPPTPGRHPQDLPPESDPIFAPPGQLNEPGRLLPDPNDHALIEYMRTHPNARLVQAPDGRVVAIEDTQPLDPRGLAINPIQNPPHGIPLVHGYRHESGPGFEPNRQLPPLNSSHASGLPASYEHSAELSPHNHSSHHHSAPPWPAEHSNNNHRSQSSTSNSHHRHSSSRTDLEHIQGGERGEGLPPPSSSHRDQEQGETRGRRHETHELGHSHLQHSQARPHIQVSAPSEHSLSHSPSSPSLLSPTSARAQRSIHNHQRVGPGAHINTERDPDYQRELLRRRELERDEEQKRERERESGNGSSGTRKRGRNEMEVDEEHHGGSGDIRSPRENTSGGPVSSHSILSPPSGSGGTTRGDDSHLPNSQDIGRGSKRVHQDDSPGHDDNSMDQDD
ncbi:hypothetical protein C8Q75DRAFT_218013 [Abortiporus biennis]|nr:hypothetical protein C8Q75DRAFT_218013 [Abortiporus biennis]